jgi:hypothetical protein
MADLVLANFAAVFTDDITEIRTQLAGTGGVTIGQPVYLDPTTGTVLPTDGTAAGKVGFRGIAMQTVGAGQGVDVVEKGYVNGFDVSALAFDALVYASNTVGKLGTTAGTNSSVVGRVAALSDRDPVTNKPSKLLYIRPSVI